MAAMARFQVTCPSCKSALQITLPSGTTSTQCTRCRHYFAVEVLVGCTPCQLSHNAATSNTLSSTTAQLAPALGATDVRLSKQMPPDNTSCQQGTKHAPEPPPRTRPPPAGHEWVNINSLWVLRPERPGLGYLPEFAQGVLSGQPEIDPAHPVLELATVPADDFQAEKDLNPDDLEAWIAELTPKLLEGFDRAPSSVPPSPPFPGTTNKPTNVSTRIFTSGQIWAAAPLALQKRPLSLCSLLIIALAVAMSKLSLVPAFCFGAFSAAAGLLTLYTLGARRSTHLTCALFVAAVLALLRDAILLTPTELTTQINDAREGAPAVVLVASCIGAWLGSRPPMDISHHLKLLTISLMEATVITDNYIRFGKTGDKADLLFPRFHFHAPMVTMFIVGLFFNRPLDHGAQGAMSSYHSVPPSPLSPQSPL